MEAPQGGPERDKPNPSSSPTPIVANFWKVARQAWRLLRGPSENGSINSVSWGGNHYQTQQWRGIRVKVRDGNLEQALTWMQRKMQSSGIERLIKKEQRHHIKNSEKRILARKNLERKIRSQDLARKLKAILVKKVRGL